MLALLSCVRVLCLQELSRLTGTVIQPSAETLGGTRGFCAGTTTLKRPMRAIGEAAKIYAIPPLPPCAATVVGLKHLLLQRRGLVDVAGAQSTTGKHINAAASWAGGRRWSSEHDR